MDTLQSDVFSGPPLAKFKGGPGYEASTVSLHSSTGTKIWNRFGALPPRILGPPWGSEIVLPIVKWAL